ncbi:MAG: response regulator transcription factor [Rhodothermales bacterium]|nr:response regulator transcription factor [Rhodothermales bacterium]
MSAPDTAPTFITLWVVEDVTTYRIELVDVLDAEIDLHVSHAFETVEDMQTYIALQPEFVPPDMVLMDIGLPGIDGISATRVLTAQFPGIKVLMLTAYEEPDRIFSAIRAGAVGYIVKNMPIDQILSLTRQVAQGAFHVAAPIATRILDHFKGDPVIHLTPRESQVLAHLATGATQKRVAALLNISPDTVNNHVRNIFEKLSVNSAPGAIARAYQLGLL